MMSPLPSIEPMYPDLDSNQTPIAIRHCDLTLSNIDECLDQHFPIPELLNQPTEAIPNIEHSNTIWRERITDIIIRFDPIRMHVFNLTIRGNEIFSGKQLSRFEYCFKNQYAMPLIMKCI